MRLAAAHVLALVAYIGALWCCFALLLGVSGDLRSGIRFERQGTFEFAVIYMMFIGPVAFFLLLVYFAALRARMLAIGVLFASSIVLGLVFLYKSSIISVDRYLLIGIVWIGVTAALAHHVVYAALRPRVIKEPVSHA